MRELVPLEQHSSDISVRGVYHHNNVTQDRLQALEDWLFNRKVVSYKTITCFPHPQKCIDSSESGHHKLIT